MARRRRRSRSGEERRSAAPARIAIPRRKLNGERNMGRKMRAAAASCPALLRARKAPVVGGRDIRDAIEALRPADEDIPHAVLLQETERLCLAAGGVDAFDVVQPLAWPVDHQEIAVDEVLSPRHRRDEVALLQGGEHRATYRGVLPKPRKGRELLSRRSLAELLERETQRGQDGAYHHQEQHSCPYPCAEPLHQEELVAKPKQRDEGHAKVDEPKAERDETHPEEQEDREDKAGEQVHLPAALGDDEPVGGIATEHERKKANEGDRPQEVESRKV